MSTPKHMSIHMSTNMPAHGPPATQHGLCISIAYIVVALYSYGLYSYGPI